MKLLGGAAVAIVLLSIAATWGARGLRATASADAKTQVFAVHDGEPLRAVVDRLDAEGFLPKRLFFGPRMLAISARLSGRDRAIKSGEYDLSPAMTPLEILDKLVAGQVKTYEVTIPEGLRLDEVAQRLEAAGIARAKDFLALAFDPQFAAVQGITADSLEGYAYPETYRFRRDTAPEQVLERMLEEFRRRWTPADETALAGSGLSRHEALTLASIVEKETAVVSERPVVAGVYRNRLRSGMRLQSDPTVIYGVLRTRGRFDGNLRLVDLHSDNPWNTYTRTGLPPGPIASASMASIRAVLAPADVSYLYFVSRNDGTHVFSASLFDHNRAVAEFQRRPARGDPR